MKAYVGGTSYRYFKYDMAKQGRRQVGSTIKPFVYTFAIEQLDTDALHASAESARDDRDRQRALATPREASKVEYTTASWKPLRAGAGQQPQQLFGLDHEARRGSRRLWPTSSISSVSAATSIRFMRSVWGLPTSRCSSW
ncbi:MAG: hypothetical protein ACLTZY_02155 [Alistipes indistinctus]